MSNDPKTPVIDTHLHFWNLETNYREHAGWLEDSPSLQRSFLPEDVKPAFDACGVDKGIIIECARTSHKLNLWWLQLAAEHDYIGSVVAGCFLEQEDLSTWFDEYAQSPDFVGVRTSPAGSPDSWLDNPATLRGLQELSRRTLSLDLLVGFDAFAAVGEIAARFPELRICLNHCGNPPIAEGRMGDWAKNLRPLANQPNIMVKYSSLLFYTKPDTSIERIQPVADFLISHFGSERLVWGSNWPVELLGGSYEESFEKTYEAMESLTSAAERQAIFGGNAARFYRVQDW